MGGGASIPSAKLKSECEQSQATMTSKFAGAGSYGIELAKCVERSANVEVSKADAAVVALPRGGILVNHSKGTIQFGLPPETIKDSMLWGLSVPTTFVILGDEMFDRQLGINIAEFEFPAYFNFFVFGKRVTLITTQRVEHRVREIFQETLLGPKPGSFDLSQDFSAKLPGGTLSKQNSNTHWPDFVQEGLALDSQRESISVDALLNFEIVDRRETSPQQQMEAGGTGAIIRPNEGRKIILDKETNTYLKWNKTQKKYLVREDKRTIAQVDHKFLKPRIRKVREIEHEPFDVPLFGVTMLGTSHGFDPMGTTTGFVVWVNRRGIMVDPPPDSAEVLRDMAIPMRLIDGMILTHCHADHDAGAFQKILADSSIKIYTTQTIMDSFIRKYSAISNLDPNFLRGLFVFERVKIGEKKKIHGGLWDFFYSLHVIPTIGFEVRFANEGIVYSGDTCTNFKLFDKMLKEKRIGKGRYEDLVRRSPVSRQKPARKGPNGKMLPAYNPHILHEAGVPPIHTPIDILVKLPPEVRERMFVVHVDENLLSKDSVNRKRLKTLPQWSTLRINVDEMHSDVVEKDNSLVALLSTVPFFKYLRTQSKLEDLLEICKLRNYPKGSVLCKPGDIWSVSYVVRAGIAVETELSPTDPRLGLEEEEVRAGTAAEATVAENIEAGGPAKVCAKPTYYYVGGFFGEQSLLVGDDDEDGLESAVKRTSMAGQHDAIDGTGAGAPMDGNSMEVGQGVEPTSGGFSDDTARVVQYNVVAKTDLFTVEFPRDKMLKLLRSSEIGETVLSNISAVAKSRCLETWNIVRLNDTLDRIMSRIQQQEFQKMLSVPKRYAKYETIFGGGSIQLSMILVASGEVNLFYRPPLRSSDDPSEGNEDGENIDLEAGALLGDVNCLKDNRIANHSITAKTECTVYEIPRIAIVNFWNRFPGIKLQCIDRRYIV